MKRVFFKLLAYGFFGLVGLAILLWLIVAEENFRGKRAWESYKRDAVARGVKLDWKAFVPPPVPDDQNFAMTPLLKPLFGADPAYAEQLKKRLDLPEPKQGKKMPGLGNRITEKRINLAEWSEYFGDPDVLHALKRFDPEMDEISAACRKPYSRFPLRYEDPVAMRIPLMALSKLFVIRASANLAQGHPSEALDDCETVLHLADAMKDEPTLICEVVRCSIFAMGQNVIWQGLSAHQWSVGQLAALQSELQRIDLLGDTLHALHYEMIGLPAFVESRDKDARGDFAKLMSETFGSDSSPWCVPRACLYQNLISVCRFYEQEVFPAFDPSARRINPQKVKAIDSQPRSDGLLRSYTFMVDLFRGSVGSAIRRCAFTQTVVDEAAIACALERYRLVHNEYPENLNALVPQYFSNLPHDVITGEALHYSRGGDGRFLLYSVGWNETDDHGTVAMQKNSDRQDITQGDWVWR